MKLPIRYNKYNRILLNKHFNNINKKLKVYFTEQYKKYDHLYTTLPREDKCKTIGSTYMVLMVSFTITRIKNPNEDINKIFIDNFFFAMMYSLVDTLLDTPGENREESISAIKSILYNGTKTINTPLIDALYEIYIYFSFRKEVIEAMKKAFIEEYRSYLIQYNKHEETDYDNVCESIGYTMYNLFLVINNLGVMEEYDKIVGYVGQVADDIADIDEDIKGNINTIATFIYQRDGNVDVLYENAIKKLETLPDEQYGIVKYPLAYLFYYVISKSKYVSEKTRNNTKEYSLPSSWIDINKDLGKYIYSILE